MYKGTPISAGFAGVILFTTGLLMIVSAVFCYVLGDPPASHVIGGIAVPLVLVGGSMMFADQ